MIAISGWFSFQFSHEDALNKPTVNQYAFQIKTNEQRLEEFYRNYHAFEQKAGQMAEYGIHDMSAGPGDIEGFVSYEIEPSDQMPVMIEWNEWFKQQGFEVGPVVEIPLDEDGYEPLIPPEQVEENRKFDTLTQEVRKKIFSE